MGDYHLIQCIIEGEFPSENMSDHKGEINKNFFEKVEKTGVDFESLLKSTLDDIGRIYMFKRFFEWVPYSEEELDLYRKNKSTASILREIGKAALAQKNLKEALKYYNLAVAFAPNINCAKRAETETATTSKESEEEGLLCNNPLIQTLSERSAILLQARGGEEALRDVEHALSLIGESNTDPTFIKVREELRERKTKCQTFIEEKASFMRELAKDSLEEMEKRLKYKNLLLFKVKKPNPMIPSAESFVEIKVDPDKGRLLVVNRDIPAGTTVVVEKPYVKVLKNGLKWDMQHCHSCFMKIRGGGGIPCPGCVFEIYCSESCREKALLKYHTFECPCMAYFHFTSTPRHVHLAIRIVCTIGPRELYRLFITKDPNYFLVPKNSPIILGSNPESKIYESDSYLPIFHLISHFHNVETRNEVEYFTNVIQGLIYANILEKLSSFYKQVTYLPTHPQEYFKTFVASIILHHIENIPCNSISVDELVGMEGISLLVKEPTILQERIRALQFPQYATATYALSSLINHSCDPNVTRIHDLNDAKMALVTLKGLKAGEELVTSYTKIFLADTVEERRDYLLRTYNFACNCIACIQKWPILAKISETEPRFSCPTCTKKFSNTDKATPAFARCILDKKGYCRNCKKKFDLSELREQLDIRIESFFEAYDLILKNKPFEAIRLLSPCAQFFQDNVCPPYNKIYMSQDLQKTATDLIVYYTVPRT